MSRSIIAGETLTAIGTVFLPFDLSIEGSAGGGGPGGTGLVSSSAFVANGGTIAVAGGGPVGYSGGPIGGGTLMVDGTLVNAGLVTLTGGSYGPGGFSGGGGYLADAGTLINIGTILVGVGVQLAGEAFNGRGGVFDVTGVLLNYSTITVQAGAYAGPYSPGTLVSLGSVLNAGVLTLVGGSVSGSPAVAGGFGSVFDSHGALTNTGILALDGGAGATVVSAHGGYGAELLEGEICVNDGTIMLAGGAAGLETHTGHGAGFGGGYGARLFDGGVFVNNGVVTVGAGGQAATALEIAGSGAGAVFGSYNDTVGFVNNGTIIVAGATGSPVAAIAGVYSGILNLDLRRAYNTGLIVLDGAGNNEINGGVLSLGGKFSLFTLVNSGTISVGVETAAGGAPGGIGVGRYNTLKLAGGSIVQSGVGPPESMIYNSGTISGFGVIDVNDITNNSVIVASGGLLCVNADIGEQLFHSGRFVVDPNATLELAGTIGSAQSLSLASTGTLIATAKSASIRINSPDGGNLIINSGGTAALNAQDSHLTVSLAAPATLTLSAAGFITAIGSSGPDTIIAEAQNQTLAGNGGGDTLIGYSGDGDRFLGTAVQLNGDTVGNFAGSDVIDVTDLLPGSGLALVYTQGVGEGTLTLSEGTQTTSITLLGSFTQSQFSVTSDGAAGTLVHPTPLA